MSERVYRETFDQGPGGWLRTMDNVQPLAPLVLRNGAIWSYSPWWVDYNHAPPGAGYIQLLMCLNTKGPFTERVHDVGGVNRFVQGGFGTDFTNARMALRIKGELELRGARVVLLIQGSVDGKISGWLLTGQPITVTSDWSEPTITLVPDAVQWTPLGSRHDRTDMYGVIDLKKILGNVNVNLYLVMFPVTVVPMGPIDGDPHVLRAGRDYPLWQSKIPEGYVGVDTVQIAFPQ